MTLTIELPSDLAQAVSQLAARCGQDVSAFVLQVIQDNVAKARNSTEICRGASADEVIAMLAMPQPVPDDAQCQQLLEDELLKKYGR